MPAKPTRQLPPSKGPGKAPLKPLKGSKNPTDPSAAQGTHTPLVIIKY